jgi:hypothetical protein
METSFTWPTAILLAVIGCYLILIYISYRMHQRMCALRNFTFTLINELYFEEQVMKLLRRAEALNHLSLTRFQESCLQDNVYDRDLFSLKQGSAQQENEMMKLLIVQYGFFKLLKKLRPVDQAFILQGITDRHLPSRQRFINQILQSCGFPATMHIALFKKQSALNRLKESSRKFLLQEWRIFFPESYPSPTPIAKQQIVS